MKERSSFSCLTGCSHKITIINEYRSKVNRDLKYKGILNVKNMAIKANQLRQYTMRLKNLIAW